MTVTTMTHGVHQQQDTDNDNDSDQNDHDSDQNDLTMAAMMTISRQQQQ